MMSTHGRFAAALRRLDLHKTMCIAMYYNSYKATKVNIPGKTRITIASKFSVKLAVHARTTCDSK